MKSKFQKLMDQKKCDQDAKMEAIDAMSEADWELARQNLEKARAEGRMPAKIQSRRPYKPS